MSSVRIGVCVITVMLGFFTSSHAGPAPTGTVSGRVDIPEQLVKLLENRGYASLYRQSSRPTVSWVEESVVYLETVPGPFPPPSRRATIRHNAQNFVPCVLPVLKGTVVAISSDDPYDHFFKSHTILNPPFRHRLKAGGPSCLIRTSKTGEILLSCDAHLKSECRLLVLQNPFFTKVEATGTFVLKGVPRGVYNLCVWHPDLSSVQAAVTVSRGKDSIANLSFEKAR
jgi:hypothetical protein